MCGRYARCRRGTVREDLNMCDLRAEGAIGKVGERDQQEAQAGMQDDRRG